MFALLIHDNFQVSPTSITTYSKYCPLGTGSEGNITRVNETCNSQQSKNLYNFLLVQAQF